MAVVARNDFVYASPNTTDVMHGSGAGSNESKPSSRSSRGKKSKYSSRLILALLACKIIELLHSRRAHSAPTSMKSYKTGTVGVGLPSRQLGAYHGSTQSSIKSTTNSSDDQRSDGAGTE